MIGPISVHLRRLAATALVAGVATLGASAAAAQSAPQPVMSAGEAAAIVRQRDDSVRRLFTDADAHFMAGMIGHHSQAIAMSKWAPTHEASPEVQRLADRIINAQQDEILTMQTWLRDRKLPVPDATTMGMKMTMNGAEHVMLMPGMLTDEQMQQLDQSRGDRFDELFLRFMMQHHRGAVSMVKDLFGSYGAGQDEIVFKFASDVNVDQTTEIARMQRMLNVMLLEGRTQ